VEEFEEFEFVAGFDDGGERCISKAIVSNGAEISALMVDQSAISKEDDPYEVINIEGSRDVIIAISVDFVNHILESSPSKMMGAYALGSFVGQMMTDVARDILEGYEPSSQYDCGHEDEIN
jgi:hypothetical protein